MNPFRPELFFGFIGPLGIDLKIPMGYLEKSLKALDYKTRDITLIRLLEQIHGYEPLDQNMDYYDKFDLLMKRGNEFRRSMGTKDALALLAISNIADIREDVNKNLSRDKNTPLSNTAYIFRSLKTPEEVSLLRKTYEASFYLISVYSSVSKRKQYLRDKILSQRGKFKAGNVELNVDDLIVRDQKEEDTYGQNLTDCFPLADLFIDMDVKDIAEKEINRFVELIFGCSLETPSKSENAMFHAKAAALRSGSLARQVGAVIVDDKHEIISVGTNEVPRAMGGQYWNGDTNDARDVTKGKDISDVLRFAAIKDLLVRLDEIGALKKTTENINEFFDKLMFESELRIIKKSQVMNIIEFSRAVHAEMSALINAARTGISVQNCIMYVTTFPCHDCAKHIVDAGIKKVIYIEPYPKSLVSDLFADSIMIDPDSKDEEKVIFKSFSGISPNKYSSLFTMLERKDKKGNVYLAKKEESLPRDYESHWEYIPKEMDATKHLATYLKNANFNIKEEN